MSDEAFDYMCTACSEESRRVEAVTYCAQCSGYCCKECTDDHKRVRVLKNHKLQDVRQESQVGGQQSNSSLLEIPIEQCSLHRGKVVDMMECSQALPGIGQLQKHGKQKHNVYKIKGSRDITIKLSQDSKTCGSQGCCLTQDNQLLVTDFDNKKLKRIDIQKMTVVDYCNLHSAPYGVCCVSKNEVAVACYSDNKIQFVSIHNKMTPTKQIKMSNLCYGIAFNDGQLYVTGDSSLYVYDMTGTLLKTIKRDNAGNRLFSCSLHVTFNESGDRMFVGGGLNGLVCFDGMGNYLSTITDTDLQNVSDVCVDGRGNMFVVAWESHTAVQFSENGKKLGVVVKQGDGLQFPQSVCFHQGLNIMFFTKRDSDVVKMYELE